MKFHHLRWRNSREMIAVHNRWGFGNGQPFLIEKRPNLKGLFSMSVVHAGQYRFSKTGLFGNKEERRRMRLTQALAYLAHPEPRARAAAIQRLRALDFVDPMPILIDMLADSSRLVRAAAAQAIWDKAAGTAGLRENSMAQALCRLRDVMHRKDAASSGNQAAALLALEALRNQEPARRHDFNRWLVYAWCYGDERLIQYGDKLLTIFAQEGTFLDTAVPQCQRVGDEIKEKDGSIAMQIVMEAIQITLGAFASRELTAVWRGKKPQGRSMPLGLGEMALC